MGVDKKLKKTRERPTFVIGASDLPRRERSGDAGTLDPHSLFFMQAMATRAEKHAFELLDQQDMAGAQEQFRQVFSSRIKIARSYHNLACVLRDQGDDPGAARFLEEALKLCNRAIRADDSGVSAGYVKQFGNNTERKPLIIADALDLSAVHVKALLDDAVIVKSEYDDILKQIGITPQHTKDEGLMTELRDKNAIDQLIERIKDRPELAMACLKFLDKAVRRPEYAKLSAELTEDRLAHRREQERQKKARYRQKRRNIQSSKSQPSGLK